MQARVGKEQQPIAQDPRVAPESGSRWSARSSARTNDLDDGEERRSVGGDRTGSDVRPSVHLLDL